MSRKPHEPRLPLRLARLHARLLISVAVGVAITLALSFTNWRLPTRLLAGWDVGVALYLVLAYWLMSHASPSEIRRRASVQDEGATALLMLSAAAALASLVALIAEIGTAQSGEAWANLAIGMVTIVLSCQFVHTIFALHYAHEYYGEGRDDDVGGLKFPGAQSPDYLDFLYFSFVIAMTSQVSDVGVTGRVIRRLVNKHGVLSFFFNISVLAVTVNLVSGLIRPG